MSDVNGMSYAFERGGGISLNEKSVELKGNITFEQLYIFKGADGENMVYLSARESNEHNRTWTFVEQVKIDQVDKNIKTSNRKRAIKIHNRCFHETC